MASPTITTIGPFTTPFTVPDWCNTPLISCGEPLNSECGIYTGITCGDIGEPTRASSCFPGMESRTGPVMTSWIFHGDWSQTMLYSPAIACPDGLTSACEEGGGGPRTVICCGQGFNCERGYCVSSHYDTTSSVNYCLGTNTMTLTFTAPLDSPSNIPITLSRSEFVLSGNTYTLTDPYASGLQIGIVVDQSTGLGTWTSETARSTSSSFFGSQNPPNSGGGSSSSGGMGFGAKVGVGVAVPAVIIILSSIFAFVCARRRRRQKMYGATATTGPGEENRDPASGHEVWGKPELQGDIDEQKGGGAIYQKAELQGVPGGPPPVLPPGAVVQDQRETTVPATETQYAVPEMAAAYHGNRPELHDQGATIVEAGGNQAREHPPELHSQHSHIMELSSERGETERVQLSSGDEGWRPHQSEFSQNPPWTQTWPVEYGTPNAQAAQSVQPVQPTTDDTQMNAARLAELEAKKADVDEKLNRARQMEALEEEQARIQAEIEALKNKG